MSNSILASTKKKCGLSDDYTVFDQDIIDYINAVFSTLNQLGIGPLDGFSIEDAVSEWDEYVTDARLNSVKTYMYLRVRMLFDPPTTSYLMTAMKEQIQELEWRLEVQRVPVIPAAQILLPDDSLIYDGGTPSSSNDSELIYDGGTP